MDHRSLRSARVPRRAAALGLTAALSVGALVSSHAASAEEEIIVDVQPPAPRVEVIPVAPSAHHFWIHGYYGWVGGRHVWVPGRYEVMRPGWSWSEARWGLVGRRWHFYPGHWYR